MALSKIKLVTIVGKTDRLDEVCAALGKTGVFDIFTMG